MSEIDLDEAAAKPPKDWRETVAVILMSVTAVLTAWAGFQAAKWAGESSVLTAQASTARIEGTRWEADANKRQAIHVVLFSQWVQASEGGDKDADYIAEHFPSPLIEAFAAWQTTADRPLTPFEMPQYVITEHDKALDADARAEALFQGGVDAGARSESYIGTTVLFAIVLFFAAMSGKIREKRLQWFMIGVGLVLFVYEAISLLTYPKLL